MLEDKIFVQIPSFADTELIPTVKDLLENANRPDNIQVVIINQSTKEHDISEIEFLPNVLVLNIHHTKGKGVCWAVGNALNNLDPGFKYFLQVDSHMRFDKGWDDVYIKEIESLPPKSVISVYPPQYHWGTWEKTTGYQVNYVDHVRENGSFQFGAKTAHPNKDGRIPNSTIACGFIFGPIEYLYEVPQDPYMDFVFQELDLTVRTFTHGWNIYAPSFLGYIYHLYSKNNKMVNAVKSDNRGLNQKNRFYYKLGYLSEKDVDEEDLFRIKEYPIGNKRTLKEFEQIYNTKFPLPSKHVISIPVAVHNDHFKWQLDLFWYYHKKQYGEDAYKMAHAIILKRNHPPEEKVEELQWDLDIPHSMCDPYFDFNPEWKGMHLMQTNIQIGLQQIIKKLDDNDIVEILDCDMFHLKHRPPLDVRDDEVYVATEYEDWHLKSKTDNKDIIARYLHNTGGDYNGGFVPIICNVRTLKKILPEWIAVNVDIVKQDYKDYIYWWSAMYALSASCEKNNVNMIEYNKCYIHRINKLDDEKYICHYSVDGDFIHKNNKEHLFSKDNYIKCKESDNHYANKYAEWFEQSEYYE